MRFLQEREYILPNSKEDAKKNKTVFIIFGSLLFCLIFTLVVNESYTQYIAHENECTTKSFTDAASMEKELTFDFYTRLTAEVENLGQVLTYVGTDDESISRILYQQLNTSQADAALVFASDGSGVYGNTALYAQFSKTAQEVISSGNVEISDITECSDGVPRFGVAVPVNTKGETVAVMLLYPRSALSHLFENKDLASDGNLWLADSDGKYVAGEINTPSWIKEKTFELDLKEAAQGKLIKIGSTPDGVVYLACAKQVGINDLYAVFMEQKSTVDEKEQAGIKQIYIISSATLIFLLLLLGSGIYTYNVRAANLRLYQKKFRIATSQSARAAFEYDKRTDRLKFISECENISLPKPYISLSELGDFVHPDDRGLYSQSVAELRTVGTTSKVVRVSHFAGTEDYKWYNVTATRLTDRGEGKALTIGTVEDIDERERERLVLYEKATTDSLTGLCNRAETERKIDMRLKNLEENEHSAFALIDLDDFKNINDEYGHDFGDKVLSFFAGKLRATFRFGDVIGRLGGDEFVVYMTLTSDHRVVRQRLKELMEGLELPKNGDFVPVPRISCSAGCCMASKGDTFEILYKRADNSLYTSKTRGKAQAVID